jgi:hypothetical protein
MKNKTYCVCKDCHVSANGIENIKCAYCGKLTYACYLGNIKRKPLLKMTKKEFGVWLHYLIFEKDEPYAYI